jgi:tol-pal system protein YbgF
METEAAGGSSTQQSLLQEVRSLSAKMDDANTKIAALAQQIADMKVQSQPITQRLYQTAGENPNDLAQSADQIFREAYNDLIQGKTDLAIGGFNAFLMNFPTNDKADDAQYYIGEAYYSAKRYPEAIAAFDRVLTDYGSGDKIANALYKRGKAKLELGQKDSAVDDFKVLLQDFPVAPETNLARIDLEKLGINPSTLAKSPVKRKKSP